MGRRGARALLSQCSRTECELAFAERLFSKALADAQQHAAVGALAAADLEGAGAVAGEGPVVEREGPAGLRGGVEQSRVAVDREGPGAAVVVAGGGGVWSGACDVDAAELGLVARWQRVAVGVGAGDAGNVGASEGITGFSQVACADAKVACSSSASSKVQEQP
jgi:hypothetical protein